MKWESEAEWRPYRVETRVRIPELYSMFVRKCPSGYDFPGETHDFWECLYVLRGEVCVSGDDRVYQLSEGDIIFHKPLEMHKFYVEHGAGADLLIFSFTLDSAQRSFFAEKAFSLSEEQKGLLSSMLVYMDQRMAEMDVPEDVVLTKRYLYPSCVNHVYLQAIVLYLERLFLSLLEQADTTELFDSAESRLFSDAVNCMKKHIHTGLSVAELAEMCNISISGLKRIFDKYAGISVHKYFLKLKLQNAVEMLMGGATVSETAVSLGFSSQAYFTKAFRRELGQNPSEIKK